MLMLALVFILFAITEAVQASGGIAVFVFGIMMGNAKRVGKLAQVEWQTPVTRMMRLFQDEVTFFVRTFFFVYVGLLFSLEYFTTYVMVVALGLTAILLIPRFIAKKMVLPGIHERDGNVAMTMMPRGLAAVVLATLPLTKGLTIPNFQEIVFTVLLFSNIAATLGLFLFDRPGSDEEKDEKKKQEPKKKQSAKKKTSS
jgi:cell volume regulation protein A